MPISTSTVLTGPETRTPREIIISIVNPTITARLRLRPLSSGDAPELVALLDDWQMVRYTSNIPFPYDLNAARSFIVDTRRLCEEGKALVYAVEDRLTGYLAACVGATFDEQGAEIGYWVGRAFWGRGYASEALGRLITLLFRDHGVDAVRAEILPENVLSRRVAQQQGLSLKGRRRAIMPARGESTAVFDILSLDKAGWLVRRKQRPHLLVSAAALIDETSNILIARRPEGKSMAGFWEFPGGKVDPGETPEGALARELFEELGIDAKPSELIPFTFSSYDYDSFHLTMPLFVCRSWSGTANPKEGQQLAWVSLDSISNYLMPPADLPLTARLKAWL